MRHKQSLPRVYTPPLDSDSPQLLLTESEGENPSCHQGHSWEWDLDTGIEKWRALIYSI